MTDPDLPPLARALGRIPSGLFIVTTEAAGRPIGFLGSFVMQTGFAPPTVCVAVGKTRDHLDALRARRAFTLSVVDARSRGVMGAFFKRLSGSESPYDGLATERAPSGLAVLADTLAWLDCAVVGEHATGDHVVVFGEVRDGAVRREGDPAVHLRANGLAY